MSSKSQFSREKYVNSVKTFKSQPTLKSHCVDSTKERKMNKILIRSTSVCGKKYDRENNQANPSSKFSTDKDSNIQRKGYKFTVLLPHILDFDYVPIKQPLILRIQEVQLFEFGFNIPFDGFFDEINNHFRLKIGDKTITAQIIATGDNMIELKDSFKKNIEKNSTWKGMRKLKGNPEFVVDLEHVPLLDSDDTPEQLIMDEAELQALTSQLLEKGQNVIKKQIAERRIETEYEEFPCFEKIYRKRKISKNDNEESYSNTSENNDQVQIDIEEKFKILKQKKMLLSDSDVLSSTLKQVIDLLTNVFHATNQKKSNARAEVQIPEIDQTFKNKKKNQIFIEGNIQLDLDKYDFAVKQSKPRNPYSLAYQLVHRAFPEVYWKNITLGKKFYEVEEIDNFSDQRTNTVIKLPLVYIWGFKDPYSEPFIGEFNLARGQRRVQSLIDHIFRISGFKQYNEEEENKVRVRLVKELSWKNKNFKQIEKDEKLETDQIESDDNDFQNVWNDDYYE